MRWNIYFVLQKEADILDTTESVHRVFRGIFLASLGACNLQRYRLIYKRSLETSVE